MKKAYIIICLFVLIFWLIDQMAKLAVLTYLKNPMVFNSWLSLRYAQNYGIAWGLVLPQQLILPVNILIILLIPFFIVKYIDFRKTSVSLLIGLIFGGALGNLTDRILKGYVVDFITVGWWPVFNFADAFLSLGIFLIIVFYGKIKQSGGVKLPVP